MTIALRLLSNRIWLLSKGARVLSNRVRLLSYRTRPFKPLIGMLSSCR